MTTTSGGTRCSKYCWKTRQGWGDSFHHEGCPEPLFLARGKSIQEEVADQKKRMVEWEKGYQHGFNCDHENYGYIRSWQYPYYSKSYIFGYRVGKSEIDRMVDEAHQSNYSMDC